MTDDDILRLDSSDLESAPASSEATTENETIDLTHLAPDNVIVIESKKRPLEDEIEIVFEDDDEAVQILDEEDDIKIRFIEDKSREIESQIKITEERWEYDFDEKVRQIENQIVIFDRPEIDSLDEISEDIKLLTKKEEQLLMLLRILDGLKLSPDVKRRIAAEIQKLLQRIRNKYQDLVRLLQIEEEAPQKSDAKKDKEIDIRIVDDEEKRKKEEKIEIKIEDDKPKTQEDNKDDLDIRLDDEDLQEADGGDEVIRLDLSDVSIVKEILPDGSVRMGIKNKEKIRSAYTVEIDSSILEQIIHFSETQGADSESSALLAGSFDIVNRTVIIEKVFIPQNQPENRSHTHVSLDPNFWTEVNSAMDQYNRNHPGNTVHGVGWFHTHPDLSAFLSHYDHTVHSTFRQPEYIAMVYDPHRKQLNTWHTVEASNQERQILNNLGREYALSDGRVLKHVADYHIKGRPDIDALNDIAIVQSSR